MTSENADSPLLALRGQRDRFVAFAFAAADLLLEVDGNGRIAFAAGASQRLHGSDTERLIGTAFADLLAPSERPIAGALLKSIGRGGRFIPIALRLARADAPPVVLGGCRLPNRPDAVFLSLAVVVASLPPAAEAAGAILSREEFAGAAARRLLEHTDGGMQLTLVAIDELESLQKRLTEEIGQGLAAAIARYLQTAAPRLEAAGQVGDGRYGLLHRDPIDEPRLREGVETLSRAIDPEGIGVSLRTASMPLAGSGLNGVDAARALVYCINQFAESADGEATIVSLREGLERLLADAVVRVSDFRATVSQRSFDLVYQPIVDLKKRKVHHLEALSRFAEGGSPSSTVAFAEAVRLIADFDLAVCERVIAAIAENEPSAPIAVNISGRSLESNIFKARLLQLLKPHANLAKKLLFEVTESAVITRVEDVDGTLQMLRNQGFKVCLDDFGAGANSFHYLRSFHVDFVKIDGAFARAAMLAQRDRALLQSIVSFCRDSRVATIVEMIEDERQAAAMQELGIDFAQGFLFGKPSANPHWHRSAAGRRA
jgi:EAL domain-containing protein (putative c-di-GMP-specific phosphodiesterase class I)